MNQEIKSLLYDLKELARHETPINLTSLERTITNCNCYYYYDTTGVNKRMEIFSHEYKDIGRLTIEHVNEHGVLITCCRYTEIPDLNYQVINGELSQFVSIVIR